MTNREKIEKIIADRTRAAEETAGQHDARVALAARELSGSDQAISWELRGIACGPEAYRDAYMDTIMARLLEERAAGVK